MQEEAGAEGRAWQRQHLDALNLVVTIGIILVAVNVRLAINASKKPLPHVVVTIMHVSTKITYRSKTNPVTADVYPEHCQTDDV